MSKKIQTVFAPTSFLRPLFFVFYFLSLSEHVLYEHTQRRFFQHRRAQWKFIACSNMIYGKTDAMQILALTKIHKDMHINIWISRLLGLQQQPSMACFRAHQLSVLQIVKAASGRKDMRAGKWAIVQSGSRLENGRAQWMFAVIYQQFNFFPTAANALSSWICLLRELRSPFGACLACARALYDEDCPLIREFLSPSFFYALFVSLFVSLFLSACW